MQEFMDSWTWRFRFDKSSKLPFFNASRVEYTLVRPIVDPANDRLFLNYYPSTSTGS